MDGFIAILITDLLFLALAFLSLLQRRGPFKGKDCDVSSAEQNPERGFAVEFEELGSALVPHQALRSRLDKGNRGSIGDTVAKLVASVKRCIGPGEVGFSFSFEDLSLVLANGRTVIAPQSGSIPKGSLWGVMGPSGAGKSAPHFPSFGSLG